MAVESIGALYPTNIPGYADSADIQAALRAYHYGSYSYNTANTSPASLEANSIAKFLYDIEQDIVALENRPASGGEVDTTAPAAVDFTPAEIPDGFVWVDEDGSIGGAPVGATAVFTNSVPTTSLTTGTLWVDKDASGVVANPYIATSTINAKGDLLAGSANDAVTVLSVGTNGYILSVNSATTSGLEWIANDVGDITAVTSGTGISVTNGTGPVPTVAVDTAVVATTSNTLTMSGKTLTAPIISDAIVRGLNEDVNVVASAATGTINFDISTASVWYYTTSATANHTLNFRYSSGTSLNTFMATGDAITVVWLNTNGATPYYPSTIQIDGNAVTPKVPTAISAGNASAIDAYSFTIIKTASATFTVLETQTKFA